ncbi:MAG: hypothetical protein OXB95_06115 [Rhodobacteraceae bacterium]|nr:hypothetical protein [Paracoccaceae bacterium]
MQMITYVRIALAFIGGASIDGTVLVIPNGTFAIILGVVLVAVAVLPQLDKLIPSGRN